MVTFKDPPEDTSDSKKEGALMQMRPYLKPNSGKLEKSHDSARLDVHRLLSGQAPVSWGGFLGSLPENTVDHIVKEARRINQHIPDCSKQQA